MCVMVFLANATHCTCYSVSPLVPLGGIKEMFMGLFTCLVCAPNYDGSPKDGLFIVILLDNMDYDPGEFPASIRHYGGEYTIVFSLGEC